MDGTCDMDGKDGKYPKFYWGHLKETDHVEELGTDERILLQRILKKSWMEGCGLGSTRRLL
jgi:hypothetical protein